MTKAEYWCTGIEKRGPQVKKRSWSEKHNEVVVVRTGLWIHDSDGGELEWIAEEVKVSGNQVVKELKVHMWHLLVFFHIDGQVSYHHQELKVKKKTVSQLPVFNEQGRVGMRLFNKW